MPSSIESYVPQTIVRAQRRQALAAWGAIFFLALAWVFLIVAAPLAKAGGLNNFADSIYGFFGYLCHQISWRSYHLGEHPLAVCARCFGFYGGFLAGIVIYPFIRALTNTEPFSRLWLFLAMIPMGVDWGLEFLGLWNNTHLTRLASGGLLGAACAFFIVPALVEINYFFAERFGKRS